MYTSILHNHVCTVQYKQFQFKGFTCFKDDFRIYIHVIPIIKKGLEMYFIHVLLKALLSCWVIDFALLPCWAINPFWLDQ